MILALSTRIKIQPSISTSHKNLAMMINGPDSLLTHNSLEPLGLWKWKLNIAGNV